MKAIIFFSNSKKHFSKNVAKDIEGDHFEIENLGKKIKFIVFQMIYFGYITVFNKPVKTNNLAIDFEKYDEIVLVSPVWAGRACAFMKQLLLDNQFKDKQVTIIATAGGMNKKYFSSFDNLIDKSNNVEKHMMYVKDKIIYERSV